MRAQQEVKALKKLCEYLQALRLLKQEGEEEIEKEKKEREDGDVDIEGESEGEQIKENGDSLIEEGMDAADAYVI